jgi:hypothetical protein
MIAALLIAFFSWVRSWARERRRGVDDARSKGLIR